MTKHTSSARPLSAGLLVSKGAARPAQVFGQRPPSGAPSGLFDAPQRPSSDSQERPYQTPRDQPVSAPVTRSEPTAEARVDAPTVEGAKKAAFTFRMDEKRHFRLRLLSAHQNRSAQKIMEAALDAYLDTHAPQTSGMACPCFADEV
ncbi:MAG: hypothetical protein AAF221_03700 [Pseudomonadota bacterium]